MLRKGARGGCWIRVWRLARVRLGVLPSWRILTRLGVLPCRRVLTGWWILPALKVIRVPTRLVGLAGVTLRRCVGWAGFGWLTVGRLILRHASSVGCFNPC